MKDDLQLPFLVDSPEDALPPPVLPREITKTEPSPVPEDFQEGLPLKGLQAALEAHTKALKAHAGELKKLGEILKQTNTLLGKRKL